MSAKRFAILTLPLTLLFVCGNLAVGSSIVTEPFSAYMKRAELVFIGTLVKRQYVHNPVTNGYVTDLTFNVDKLIEGIPNIDKDTVTFCIPGGKNHWNTMGQEFVTLEIGDSLLMLMRENTSIATWMPRYKGLYPVSSTYSGLIAEAKKVNNKIEYTVYMWSIDKDESKEGFIKKPVFGMPLSLYVRLMRAARKHPEHIDPLVDMMFDAIGESRSDGLKYEEAHHIYYKPIIANFEHVLDKLKAANTNRKEIEP